MKIIKLEETNSTNTFLKELSKTYVLDNFTVVIAEKQSSGRGQMESKWISEDYKNLTFSVLFKFKNLKLINQRYLNFAVSLSLLEFLQKLNLTKVTIKWPNDILIDSKKICGILIENSINNQKVSSSIVGIGLNINQKSFPTLDSVSSLINETGKNYDLEILLKKLLKVLKKYIDFVEKKEFELLENEYLKNLYKMNKPSMFTDNINLFMGKIIGISKNGNLKIELENESVKTFGIKEIRFVK